MPASGVLMITGNVGEFQLVHDLLVANSPEQPMSSTSFGAILMLIIEALVSGQA